MSDKKFKTPAAQQIHDELTHAYEALSEKKYNAASQLSGYILTDDPCYITPHNNARNRIKELDRDEIIMHLLKFYFNEEM